MSEGKFTIEINDILPTLICQNLFKKEEYLATEDCNIYKKGFMLIPEESIGPCLSCGNGTIIKFCRKYNGYIGKCTTCNINWKES